MTAGLRPRRTVLLAVVAALALLGATACEPPRPPPAPPTGVCRPDPFTDEVRLGLDVFGAAGHHVTAAVYDDRTGCWYHLRQGQVMTTASVVKMEIMAGVLLRAQEQGRPLTRFEYTRLGPMIVNSDDTAATALWQNLGGARGMQGVGDRFGLGATNEIEPYWGLTTTTAQDQAAFVERLLQGAGPLDARHRGSAWWYLQHIRPDQQWGIRSGVPAGWAVGHKNGFAPSPCCGWRVNSVGYVADPAGGGYAIAILSDSWGSIAEGVPMVEAVSRYVAWSLTARRRLRPLPAPELMPRRELHVEPETCPDTESGSDPST